MLPVKYQAALASGMFVTRGLGKELRIYTKEEFDRRSKKILEYPTLDPQVQQFRHFWFSNAAEITPDQQGRFVLPEPLRSVIAVQAGDEVALVGSYEFVELYNAGDWKKQSAELNAVVAADGAQMFAKFGI
jgi:MraZ protein